MRRWSLDRRVGRPPRAGLVPLARLCLVVVGCPNYRAPNAKHGGCAAHDGTAESQDAARRRAKPQRRIWDSPRWKRTRALVWRRDGYRCVDCGRHRRELKPNEKLLADHKRGLTTILAEGGNPFDLDECETRCSTCSGRKDGSRR